MKSIEQEEDIICKSSWKSKGKRWFLSKLTQEVKELEYVNFHEKSKHGKDHRTRCVHNWISFNC